MGSVKTNTRANMWGLQYRIKELEAEVKDLKAWQTIALNILTDDQLDFKPATGKTLRERLRDACRQER